VRFGSILSIKIILTARYKKYVIQLAFKKSTELNQNKPIWVELVVFLETIQFIVFNIKIKIKTKTQRIPSNVSNY